MRKGEKIICITLGKDGICGNCERRLVGCFGLNDPLRQYFSLCRYVSQREGERREGEKMSKQRPPAPYAIAVGPWHTIIQIDSQALEVYPAPDHPKLWENCRLFAIMLPSLESSLRGALLLLLCSHSHNGVFPEPRRKVSVHEWPQTMFYLRNNFPLPVNYRWLTHVVGGQITKY